LLYLYWNKADKSLEYYNKAIDIADKISLTSKVSNLNDIALVYKSLNDVAKRTESLHNAIKIIDDNKELASSDPKFQSISFLVYTNACDLYLSYYNDKKEAKKYFDLLKSIAEETNYTEYQIYVLS
jgi:tetratricopeptide (TPR) repeat protein